MLRHEPVPDPLPSIHRFIRRWHDAMTNTDARRQARRLRLWLIPLMVLFLAIQGLTIFLVQRQGTSPEVGDYVSDWTLLGYPVYAQGDRPVAWIAVGGMPRGLVAVGGLSIGVVAIGGLAVGVVSLGGLALGVLALGGGALGLVAGIGGLALGYYSFGGLSIGGVAYAGQGVARGRYLAAGGQSERLLGRG